jgi:hypothetical protein
MTIRLLASFLCILTLAACGFWTPPANPDPATILREARADTEAARYGDALAKHVWYHQNALKLQPSQGGVRLSFALSYWVKLGAKYPAALKSLKATRDSAEKDVRSGKSPWESFHDFSAINGYLGEPARTKDLFAWLDTHKPDVAKRTFAVAGPALIRAKEYRLYGRYLEPDAQTKTMVEIFQMQRRRSEDPKIGESMREHSKKTFINQSSTLVALLVVNDRKREAEEVAARAVKELDDPKLREELDKAKKGTVPEPWP